VQYLEEEEHQLAAVASAIREKTITTLSHDLAGRQRYGAIARQAACSYWLLFQLSAKRTVCVPTLMASTAGDNTVVLFYIDMI
jgi:hypothetical protein